MGAAANTGGGDREAPGDLKRLALGTLVVPGSGVATVDAVHIGALSIPASPIRGGGNHGRQYLDVGAALLIPRRAPILASATTATRPAPPGAGSGSEVRWTPISIELVLQ